MWRDQALLLDMLIAAEDAISFIAGLDKAGFFASRLHQNAVIRSLEIIGEAANKVSNETKGANPLIPWGEMAGMRNRLIHAYNEVNLEIVWQVVQYRLPDLTTYLKPLLPAEDG